MMHKRLSQCKIFSHTELGHAEDTTVDQIYKLLDSNGQPILPIALPGRFYFTVVGFKFEKNYIFLMASNSSVFLGGADRREENSYQPLEWFHQMYGRGIVVRLHSSQTDTR